MNAKWNTRYDVSPVESYRLSYAALITCVPVICMAVLTLLLVIFAKLNLYYLETKGLVINPEIRGAYYGQVLLEIGSVSWYFLLLVVVSFSLGWVVMSWAVSPFLNAQKLLATALEEPENMKSKPTWLSESLFFDKIIWNFALQIRDKKISADQEKIPQSPRAMSTLPFLGKFILIFTLLSIMTGYIMGIFFNTIYDKIVSISLQFVTSKNAIGGHYFLAQEEILNDAVLLMIVISFFVYVLIGKKISSYMSEMIFVFCRAIKEQRLPIHLRQKDIYHPLAELMNTAFERHLQNPTKGEQIQK